MRRKSDKSLQVIAVRIDPTVEKRLRLLAETTGRKQSFFMKQIIEQGINAMEDAWLPESVLAQVRSGRLPTQARKQTRDLFGDAGGANEPVIDETQPKDSGNVLHPTVESATGSEARGLETSTQLSMFEFTEE